MIGHACDVQFLTAKPVTYILNMSEEDYKRKKNKWLGKIKQWADSHGGCKVIPMRYDIDGGDMICSVKFEEKMLAMTPEERAAYVKESGYVIPLYMLLY